MSWLAGVVGCLFAVYVGHCKSWCLTKLAQLSDWSSICFYFLSIYHGLFEITKFLQLRMHFLVKNLMIMYLILCLIKLIIDLLKILNIFFHIFSFLEWLKEEIRSFIYSITLFLTWLLILTNIVFQINLIFNDWVSIYSIFRSCSLMTSRCHFLISFLIFSRSCLDVEVWDFKRLDLSNTWRLGFLFA